jgi:hypothetical protein
VQTDKLAPGELVVVHHRKGTVAAVERYGGPPEAPSSNG